jgi:hypothetical protein
MDVAEQTALTKVDLVIRDSCQNAAAILEFAQAQGDSAMMMRMPAA